MKNKKNFIISSVLIILSIVFTFLVKYIDVKPIGVNNTNIGFSTINSTISNLIGSNMALYHITEYLGYIPIAFALIYALIGIVELIKRKSISKVDREIIILGIFYAIVVILYIFFEKVIINYRPILIDNELEASYPSTHTLLSLFLCGSSIIVNNSLFNDKKTKITNIILIIIAILIVVGRILSGVHWCTDIIGGILISSALLTAFNSFIKYKKD